MDVLGRFADTTVLEDVVRRLALRHLTLDPAKRTSALDHFFDRWVNVEDGAPRFVLPARMDENAAIAFDVGRADDPVAAYAAVEREFIEAIDAIVVTLPEIRTPMSSAQAKADRERVSGLRLLLADNGDALALSGVLGGVDGDREVRDCFVVFDGALRERVDRECAELLGRDTKRMEQTPQRDLRTTPAIHQDGAIASASLRAAHRLNALYRGEVAVDPTSLAGLAARWNRTFQDTPLTGPLTEAQLVDYANRTEWRLARRVRGAARADVSLGERATEMERLHSEFVQNVADRRAGLRLREGASDLSIEDRAEIEAERAHLDSLEMRGAQRFTARDAFETMVQRADAGRDESRGYAKTQRTLQGLSERNATERSRTDQRSHFDRIRDVRNRLKQRREALDGMEIPAYTHYTMEAYYREARSALYEGATMIDTLALDTSTAAITFDFLALRNAGRPAAARDVLALLQSGIEADTDASHRFAAALSLHVSVPAIAALVEHPDELKRYTRGLQGHLELLCAAYSYGSAEMLEALEANASVKAFSSERGFFDNARLDAIAAREQLQVGLDPEQRAEARSRDGLTASPSPLTLHVSRSDLPKALETYSPLAPYFSETLTPQRLANVLMKSPYRRAQALAQDPSLEKPLAILQYAALSAQGNDYGLRAIIGDSAVVPLPSTLQGISHSELQRRIGIVPLDGEGELVSRVEGTVVAVQTLASTGNGRKIFTQRLTPDSRVERVTDGPSGLARMRVCEGLSATHPIAGLLATVQTPSGDRVIVPIHGISNVQMGERGTPTDRFVADASLALVEAMLDGRSVSLQSNHDRFGISLRIEPPVREKARERNGSASHDGIEQPASDEIIVDGAVTQGFLQTEKRASRFNSPRAHVAILSFTGTIEGAFAHATENGVTHRVPLHVLSPEVRTTIEQGEDFRGLFAVEPQLFSPALRYRVAEEVTSRGVEFDALLVSDLRRAFGLAKDAPLHLITATAHEPIPESARAALGYRTDSFGYYGIPHEQGMTVVEYAPHARSTERLARFAKSDDRDEMDEAAQEDSRTSAMGKNRELTEPMGLPTAGTFVTDRGRWTMLPAPDATEGLVAMRSSTSILLTTNDVSRAARRGAREAVVLEQGDGNVTVATRNGDNELGEANWRVTDVATARIARLEPDHRVWEIIEDAGDHIFMRDPLAEGRRVVLDVERRELDEDAFTHEFEPGERCTLRRSADRQLLAIVPAGERERGTWFEMAR